MSTDARTMDARTIMPDAYWRDVVLEREYERIFAHGLYVGPAQLLAQDGDYHSYQVCGRPFVTRRAEGELRSFENVCLHRAKLIDPPGRGNRPFRCGYHAWQYDAAGALERAPLAQDACIGRRRLQRCATVERHGLAFMATQGTLDADTGAQALDAAGFELGEFFHEETLEHAANWKLVVENVLESYHLSFVHQDSFVPTGISSASDTRESRFGRDSCLHIANKKDGGAAKGRLIPGSNSDYVHAYVFPNLFVSITGGLVGFVSHFMPQEAGRTLLEWRLFETPLLLAQKNAVRSYIRQNAIDFTRKVLGEDLVVLNQSQIGIRHARGPHQLQPVEGRLAHFHETYMRMMEDGE
ncbi:Rieske 2Fe-2S domain-containing protein [Massilia forsythiae]|uniref:Rieske 2Fe-2S domain-containing protein n=1 Tax=Massilia forsythiae TaxID=2728020 RepID=A0A7Z2VTP7_9BURK|nr:SRPBCC family protein [Massilia forsythiae]QJD99015.1 Rieske 2Fe-2S domain-containing protein [Massilia forsythiae]